jgi:predicted metallopeptidase
MENKIDLIDRTNKIEIQYLRDRVNKLEMENQIKASIHEKLPNETSRRRNFHANKKNIGNNNRYGEGVQYDNPSVNQLNQNHFNMPFQQSGTIA